MVAGMDAHFESDPEENGQHLHDGTQDQATSASLIQGLTLVETPRHSAQSLIGYQSPYKLGKFIFPLFV